MAARWRIGDGAAVVAVIALAIWVGGLVALGACAAPIVFRVVQAPLSGDAMGAVFQRFDGIAIACGVVLLGCEAMRIRFEPSSSYATRNMRLAARTRTALSVFAVLAAIYGGTQLSPRIVELHAAGAVRGSGDDGVELERIHRRAESVAKIEVIAGLILLALHVTTLRRTPETSA
jgi:hypothetical protein